MPHIPPWELHDFDRIAICPTLHNTTKKEDSANIKGNAETAFGHLGPFDYAFWTDGSFSTNDGSSAAVCYSYQCDATTPLKCRKIDENTLAPVVIVTRPTGLVAASYTPEMEALRLPHKIMERNPKQYTGKRIFIATDSQSCLTEFSPL